MRGYGASGRDSALMGTGLGVATCVSERPVRALLFYGRVVRLDSSFCRRRIDISSSPPLYHSEYPSFFKEI